MVYFSLLEDYSWCPPSFGFGKGGDVIGPMFRNTGKEAIGKFGIANNEMTKAYQHYKIVEIVRGLPPGIACLGLCRTVRDMFDRAFRRRFGLRGGIQFFCPSCPSQLFVCLTSIKPL